MKQLIILVFVSLTSIGAYVFATQWLRLSGRGLRIATSTMLECVGLTVLFILGNLVIGVITSLTLRLVIQGHVSLYLVNDVTLLVLSLFQGVIFQSWQRESTTK